MPLQIIQEKRRLSNSATFRKNDTTQNFGKVYDIVTKSLSTLTCPGVLVISCLSLVFRNVHRRKIPMDNRSLTNIDRFELTLSLYSPCTNVCPFPGAQLHCSCIDMCRNSIYYFTNEHITFIVKWYFDSEEVLVTAGFYITLQHLIWLKVCHFCPVMTINHLSAPFCIRTFVRVI